MWMYSQIVQLICISLICLDVKSILPGTGFLFFLNNIVAWCSLWVWFLKFVKWSLGVSHPTSIQLNTVNLTPHEGGNIPTWVFFIKQLWENALSRHGRSTCLSSCNGIRYHIRYHKPKPSVFLCCFTDVTLYRIPWPQNPQDLIPPLSGCRTSGHEFQLSLRDHFDLNVHVCVFFLQSRCVFSLTDGACSVFSRHHRKARV